MAPGTMCGMVEEKKRADVPDAVSIRYLRENMADVLNEAAIYGRTIYVTSRGRRIVAVVPISVADPEQE